MPQGLVLVLQETNDDIPDDNARGGKLCFNFASPVRFISMGVMDIASGRRDFIDVTTQQDDVSTRVEISGFGNNAVQSVFVNITNVESSCLAMLGEGAVTNGRCLMRFCLSVWLSLR